ncbi:hypothetical protein Pcac1_g12296 [Phytophthora cactorum]|nr:hypothetical protein Pcac1_g12296 [Phytophthora cactorum]
MAMVHKMVGRPTQLGEVRSRGVPTQATVASVRTSLPTIKQATDPSAGRVVSSVCPIPAMVPQPRVQTGPVRRGGALNAFGLSTLVSNAVRMLPLFYSDTATIEKPQDFRELFEAHTVGLSNQSRLFVFRQKLTGREAERWWNDTTITTFKTLKTVGSVGDHTVGTDKEEKVIAEVNEVEEVGAKEVEVEDVCSLSVVQESVPEEKTDVMVIDAAEEKVGKEVFEVDKEAPVSTTFCEMAENTVDAKVVADPKVVETSKTVVVRSKVPVPKVKVLKSILKKSGGKSARVAVSISYRTNKIEIGEVVTVPVKKAAQESDCKTVDDPEGSKYAPLFTDKELAAMEACEPGQESTVLAGVKDTVEKDEYDKELEDRLYPLYEVELKRRMKNIAEAKKEPSIEDMSEYLGIPEGFSLTLEKASEAKKANRDFHQAAADSAGSLDEVDCADSDDSDKESDSEEALITVDEAAVEQRVCQYRGRRVIRGETMRGIAREAVYRMLKEAKDDVAETENATKNVETVSIPPLRDKVPDLSLERLRQFADREAVERELLKDLWMLLERWSRRRCRRRSALCFHCSSLYVESAENVGEVKFHPECDEDVPHYVQVVKAERPPPDPPPKTGLMNVAAVNLPDGFGVRDYDEDEMFEIPGVVKGGRRVVSSVSLVADKLHDDAVLGVDDLGAFGAVIDVAERRMTLKGTGETLELGVPVKHKSFMATVMVEGSLGFPPTLCVARSLGTVEDSMVIVEVCNASTEEYWVLKGTVVTSTSVIPESAFGFEKSSASTAKATDTAVKVEVAPEIVSTVTEIKDEGLGEKVKAERREILPDKDGRLKADF